ncbi:MAG: hypothetical protein ACJAS4_000301 [Bacteriovoracaceae bacterium]|jgi:uncharacterized protein YdiU (UPF0061 family)
MSVVKKLKKSDSYKKFDQIDGSHPYKEIVPNGFVDYSARIRKGGKVAYLNFELAREMGLISKGHEDCLNEELEKKLLETFSIQIINEYDQMKNKKFPESEMKKGTYMATRYLQLQHEDKKGRTSGDGRSIWNGQVTRKNKTWDVSSCGTGGTRLSPATSKFNKFFETGDPSISYGCGYAEVDEGLSTALLSRIFNLNNHSTEETLLVIEFKNNISINVRVHENLIRPSHIFLHLKQDNLEALTSLVDYYIDRQRQREDWSKCPKGVGRYDFLLRRFTKDFAKLSADFEDEYIFCWLDWDGDNILMDGGIIDYGSIRQFGLFHHEYRYDDVDRFSTNIIEQKVKAKYIVQTFVQAIEYIKTGNKTNIQDFSNHKRLVEFDKTFEFEKNKNLLERVGLSPRKSLQLLKRNPDLVNEFRKTFSYFERCKSENGLVEISDGINWDAIFSMRDLLREYAQVQVMTQEPVSDDEFIDIMRSEYATDQDVEINTYRKAKISDFQKQYNDLVNETATLFQEDVEDTLLDISKRSLIINKSERVTGDAVTYIVDLLMNKKKDLSPEALYELIQGIVASQNLDPDKKISFPHKYPKGILKDVMDIIRENREGI